MTDINKSLTDLMATYFIKFKGYTGEILPDGNILFDRKSYTKDSWKSHISDLVEAKQRALNNSIHKP